MPDFPYDEALAAVRGVMSSAWGFLAGTPIPETGGGRMELADQVLPIGAIEWGGEIEIADVGEAGPFGKPLRAVASILTLYLWHFRQETAGADDLSEMRAELLALKLGLIADRTLGGTCT